MIRCKSSCCGSLSSRCVTLTTAGCSLLLSESEAVFSGAGFVDRLMPGGRVCSFFSLLSPFFFTCQESNTYNNSTSCHSAQTVKEPTLWTGLADGLFWLPRVWLTYEVLDTSRLAEDFGLVAAARFGSCQQDLEEVWVLTFVSERDKISWLDDKSELLKTASSCLQKWLRGKPTTLRKSPWTYSTSMPPSAWMP